jgi:hypothetical protein
MTRWDLVYKWADPETRSLVDAAMTALENCDRKLTEAEARAASQERPQPDYRPEFPNECGWVGALGWADYETPNGRPCTLPDDHEGPHQRNPVGASQEWPQPDHEGYIDEFGDQRQAIEREAAAPAVDVERLAEAAGNVLDGRRIGSVRLYRNTITPDDWSAITDEYDRLGGVK